MKRTKVAAFVVVVGGLVVASHIFGAYTVEKRLFPYPSVLEQAFAAVDAYFEGSYGRKSSGESTSNKAGVVVNKPGAYDGYTFYSARGMRGARLIDNSGAIVHEWNLRYRDVWTDPPHVASGQPTSGAFWRSGTLLPDGDVLVVFAMGGTTPYGYGLAKIDRNSNVLWKYAEHVNHLTTVDDRGNVYALTHEFRNVKKDPVPNNPQLRAAKSNRVLEDFLVKLSPDGEEIYKFSILSGIADSKFSPILERFPGKDHKVIQKIKNWDVLHPNDIEIVNSVLADRVPELETGQILISFRTLDALICFDPKSGSAVWLTRGYWGLQHDPDILEDGNLLVFDNVGNAAPGGNSRIVEFNPVTGAVETRYRGRKGNPFQTLTQGSQDPLPNGNILITESNRGRLFEVDPDGNVVWKLRTGTKNNHPHAHTAVRVRPDWLQTAPPK